MFFHVLSARERASLERALNVGTAVRTVVRVVVGATDEIALATWRNRRRTCSAANNRSAGCSSIITVATAGYAGGGVRVARRA